MKLRAGFGLVSAAMIIPLLAVAQTGRSTSQVFNAERGRHQQLVQSQTGGSAGRYAVLGNGLSFTNGKAEVEYSIVDSNRNHTIDYAGLDRITRTVNDAANGYRYVTNIAPDNSWSVAITRYGTNVSQTTFDSLNNQLSAINYGYDPHGRQNSVTDARTGTTTYTFNNADQVLTVTTPDPDGGGPGAAQTTTMAYDNMGRVWKTTLPDNTSVTNEYYLTGLLKKTCGSRTYPMEYTYDAQGRMKTMKTWQDFAGNSGTATTTWNYDIYRGWLTNKTYDGGAAGPIYTYTAAGRLASRTWARGTNTTYAYNYAGDLLRVNYSDSTPDVGYGYNRLGLQTTVTNDTTLVCTFAYNSLGQVLSETWSSGPLSGLSVTNGYDSLLRRSAVALNSQPSTLVQYGYDNASRLAAVTNGSSTVAYSYLANSPLLDTVTFQQSGNTRLTTTKNYDNLNRLTAIDSRIGVAPVSISAYAYNPANQRAAITNLDNSRWVYQYDTLGQVISGKKYWSDGTPVAGQQFEYAFDDIGNRKNTAAGGDASGLNLRSANYAVNDLNQYTNREVPGFVNVIGTATNTATVTLWGDNGAFSPTSRKGEYFRGELSVTNTANPVWLTITNLAVLNNGNNPDIVTNTVGRTFVAKTAEVFSYDADGNLTQDGRWTYTWDAENRLVRLVANTGTGPQQRLDFAYDSQGRRVGKKVWNNTAGTGSPAVELQFVYDGWNLVAELTPAHATLRTCTWGLDLSGSEHGTGGVGGLISMTVPQGASAGTYFYAYDGNGNVVALVNAGDSSVAARYEYDAFGKLLRATGPLAFANPFRFSTKYQDDETGLLYYGYRYYDPDTGRWLNRDPIAERGGLNLYTFVHNNPLDIVDILGLSCREIGSYKFGLTAPAGKGVFAGQEFSATVEKCDDCCYVVTTRVSAEVGVGGKFSGKIGAGAFGRFKVGVEVLAEFSLLRYSAHGDNSFTFCPDETSFNLKVYAVDLTALPTTSLGISGYLKVGNYFEANAYGGGTAQIGIHAVAGLEIEKQRHRLNVYAFGSLTFDFRAEADAYLQGHLGNHEFNFRIPGFDEPLSWSLFDGPLGWPEERLGKLFSLNLR